ncbi:unnamed protein product, partial [Ectocarpus sp. 8 AP-2014]
LRSGEEGREATLSRRVEGAMYCMRHEVHVGVGTVSKEGPAGAGHECGSRNCRRMSEINRGRTGATILPAERKARRDPA